MREQLREAVHQAAQSRASAVDVSVSGGLGLRTLYDSNDTMEMVGRPAWTC